MSDGTPLRIVVLGGGFGGLYAALELERTLAKEKGVAVTLVSRDNFFLFTPMLHEVAAGDLDLTAIVNPVRKLLRRVSFFDGDVESVNLEAKTVTVSHGSDHHHHDLPYDHLVLGLGSVTNFFGLPGVGTNALTMKSLGDAIALRNRMIELLEEAATECASPDRARLLTFVVAGGGFAGVETIASMNDFLRSALRFYPSLKPADLKLVVVHPGPVLLPELSESLGRYTGELLSTRGVEVRVSSRVASYEGGVVRLADGTEIPAATLLWTAGTSPNPLLARLDLPREKGRLLVDEHLEVVGHAGVWAVGDAAAVPDGATGRFHPPTAQHALRQGRVLARNIRASCRGSEKERFTFSTLGQLASLGRRAGVASVFGMNFSGFLAWWLWRTIYLSKLPRFEKKVRVALDWTLDLVFSKDIVKYLTTRAKAIDHAAADAAG